MLLLLPPGWDEPAVHSEVILMPTLVGLRIVCRKPLPPTRCDLELELGDEALLYLIDVAVSHLSAYPDHAVTLKAVVI